MGCVSGLKKKTLIKHQHVLQTHNLTVFACCSDEEELKSCVLADEDAADDAPLRSKANPFQDVPHDKKASVIKEGFLQRKLHADIDGKRSEWSADSVTYIRLVCFAFDVSQDLKAQCVI